VSEADVAGPPRDSAAVRPVVPTSTSPRLGLALGTGGSLVIGAGMALVSDHSHRTIEALLLVVPVVVAAVFGGQRAALAVAAIATVTFSLVLPPVGTFEVRLLDDGVALLVFLTVAVVVGSLVARRLDLLTEVDRQRSLLLRSVSHDLRTPLAAIRAASSELVVQGEGATELAELIGDEADRLDRLVANLLSLSRLESRPARFNLQLVDLDELVDGVVARQRRLVGSTPLALALHGDLPLVHVDHALLEQVVVNLVENAVRHGGGGTVRVATAIDGDGVVLEVVDRGPGVPPTERDLIFEPFRHGGHGRSTGVGLAICRAVVEAHGGVVDVRDAPGGGAAFRVRLPAAARPDPAGRG
jgi:two-component system sensor histidine kinase KdpD